MEEAFLGEVFCSGGRTGEAPGKAVDGLVVLFKGELEASGVHAHICSFRERGKGFCGRGKNFDFGKSDCIVYMYSVQKHYG